MNGRRVSKPLLCNTEGRDTGYHCSQEAASARRARVGRAWQGGVPTPPPAAAAAAGGAGTAAAAAAATASAGAHWAPAPADVPGAAQAHKHQHQQSGPPRDMSGARDSAAAAAKCRGVSLAPPAAASAQQPQPEYWPEDDLPLTTLAAMHHLAAERRAAAAAAVDAMPPPPARGARGSGGGGGGAAALRLWQLHELLIARASVGVGSAAALMADVELLAAVLVPGAEPQQLAFAQLVSQWRPLVDTLRQQVTNGVLHPEQAHARLHSLLRVTALPEVQQLFGQPQALQRTREQLAAAQMVFSRPA